MAKCGQTLSDSEIARLLDIWSDGTIQAQLLGAVRNEVPFRKLGAKKAKCRPANSEVSFQFLIIPASHNIVEKRLTHMLHLNCPSLSYSE